MRAFMKTLVLVALVAGSSVPALASTSVADLRSIRDTRCKVVADMQNQIRSKGPLSSMTKTYVSAFKATLDYIKAINDLKPSKMSNSEAEQAEDLLLEIKKCNDKIDKLWPKWFRTARDLGQDTGSWQSELAQQDRPYSDAKVRLAVLLAELKEQARGG